MISVFVLAGVAMLIAALVRPFRKASEANPLEEQAALQQADHELDDIERRDEAASGRR